MRIVVNGGHGGKDVGAVNPANGIKEADVNYSVGKLVEKLLLLAGRKVKFIQDADLAVVCNTANEWGADVFVSIHCNAFNGHARGTETFAYDVNTSGGKLAKKVQKELFDAILAIDDRAINRGVKSAPQFYVLKNTTMPAILVELGFIDNPFDIEFLLNNQEEMAKAIVRGIALYEDEL